MNFSKYIIVLTLTLRGLVIFALQAFFFSFFRLVLKRQSFFCIYSVQSWANSVQTRQKVHHHWAISNRAVSINWSDWTSLKTRLVRWYAWNISWSSLGKIVSQNIVNRKWQSGFLTVTIHLNFFLNLIKPQLTRCDLAVCNLCWKWKFCRLHLHLMSVNVIYNPRSAEHVMMGWQGYFRKKNSAQ